MIQGILTLPDVVRTNEMPAIQFTVVIDGTVLDLTGATIKCVFKQTEASPSALSLAVGTGITLTNPTAGIFTIDKQIISIPVYNYLYDIEITVGTAVKTYIKGTLNVLQNIS